MFLFVFLQYKYKIDEVNAMSIFEESQKNPPKNVEYIKIFRESYAIIEKAKQNKNLFFEILDYSDYLYKYNAEQIFQMYSQNENASVVADFQTWKRLNNPIRKGQHSYKIIYQNESGFYQHLNVFDVSQTINPQYELYQWKMDEQRLEMLSMQLFQHPNFSQGVRQYYKMMNTHFDVDVVCGVADYLLSNKLKQDFHSESYEYLHSLIQNIETKDLTDTLNFVFEQNKGIISSVYQIQQELERMKDYEQRTYVFGNHAINSRRSEQDKLSDVTKTETARTQEEVLGGVRRNDGFTTSDSMGVRTVLRGGRDATLPSEEQYETRRPSIDVERTHASEVHAKTHANRTHGNDDVRGHYRVSDERSGEDERLGRRSETGNRESRDSEIREGTQSNAELHGKLSDSHVGEIDSTRTSESGVHARESDLHTADLSSRRNLADGRRPTNRIIQEKTIDSEQSIIPEKSTSSISNTESIVSNIQADVDQSSTPAFSFAQNQLKEIAIEELQTNQVIVRQEIPYRVGEITDRGSVQIIGLTNLENGKESKWYYFPDEPVPIYELDKSVTPEHTQEAAIMADDKTSFEAVKQTENTDDLSVYENGSFDDRQKQEITWGLENGVDVSVYADPKFDSEQMQQIRYGLEKGVDVSMYAYPQFDELQMHEIREGLGDGLDVSVYANPHFDDRQMEQIREGLKDDLDVHVYADPQFDFEQMAEIKSGLEVGVDVSIYANPHFDHYQMWEILEGLMDKRDVSIYAKPEFNNSQMQEIKLGMLRDVDVTVYAKPEFSDDQMERIREGLEQKLDVSIYADPEFNAEQMEQIKEGLSRGLDVTIFADPKYDAGQMREIALGLEDGLDISAYADTKYNYGQMRHIRMGLKSGLDVSIYADPKFSAPQMGEIKLGLLFDLDVSQYANPSIDSREMNKIREELQQQAYAERANSLSEEAKHDLVEDTLSDLDGYIRLKPTEFYKGLDVVIDDETYQILDFEDHGNGIGTLSVRTSTSTTSFYESLERIEVYAKEEDLQRFTGKEREQDSLESNEKIVEMEEKPISEELTKSTEQIELSPEQFYEGMKVTYQSEEYTIQSFENYGNGLGNLSLANDEKNATLFNSLKYMNGVFATKEEVARFESQYQKDEFDGQVQSSEHSSFSMPLFQDISTTEEKTEVSDDWTLLSEDMRYKEVGENTFLIYTDGSYSENPVDIMTENGRLYYKEREAVSIIEPYEVNLFDFEEDTPTNASIDVPTIDQEILEPLISEKSAEETKVNEVDQMQPSSIEKSDFQFTPDKLEGFYGKTPKERIADNLQAIRLLKTIEQEERFATPEEQEILAKYVGWGGLADLVDENKSNYKEERQELKDLLTPAEYASVRESVLTAYYTDPKIIQVIYEAIEKTGFKGGNILDPAMGTGNFFAAMPQEMKANSTLYGVELDSLTARLAKQLHQTAHIQQMGFEHTNFNQGSFDLVVGNVPFADFKLRDEQTLNEYYIHDYFVKRSLDLVHSGGIVAVITSSGTMDKQDKSFRTELAKQADLVGMVRLPNTAFKAIAGTEVVTDILFFQKRPLRFLEEIEKNPPLWLESNTDQSWKLVSNPAFPLTMNEYLKENVLERQENSGKKWYLFPEYQTFRGGTYTFRTREGFDYLSNIREELIDEASGILFNGKANQEVLPAIDERIRKDVPLFTYFVSDNTIQYYDGESLESLPLKGIKKERLLGMIALREQVKSIIDYQQEEAYKEDVFQAQLQTLNETYDSFVDKYGYLSDKNNSSLFSGDDYASLLLSIENEKDGKISKGDIFYRPTVRKKEVLIVQTPLEALNHSLSKKGTVDMDYMLSIYETTKEQLLSDLDNAIFALPNGYETKEEYLSGDVKTKLTQAKQWATENPIYQKHVQALEEVQPKDLGVGDIHVELGARWIPEEIYRQFIMDELDIPQREFRWGDISLNYSGATDTYYIKGKTHFSSVTLDQSYGTSRINALQILEKTLNYSPVKIYDVSTEIVAGEVQKTKTLNQKETILAKAQQEKIKQRFHQWLFDNPERAEKLLNIYNERFNRIRPRVYDGSYLNFESMNVNYQLYDHQKNVVARIIENGKALMAHEVGAGKTASMISAGMLMKEQGLIQKPLYVVPNHLTEQFGKELLQFYPTKKVLVTTKKDFQKENRKKFISRIATGNYDAIIIGHSQFEKINISKERRTAMIEREIFEIQKAIAEAKREDNKSWTVKQMVATEKKYQQRLSKLQNEDTKDTHLTFEQLGVDYLFVDEAHNYKNLYTYTKLSNVAGINTSESLRATDMYLKCQYLLEKYDGRGVTFATGTPISNSMSEFYVLQRYLQPELLEQMNLTSFDRWASTFGEITEALEIAPEGTGFRTRTRFAKFHNLPELMNGFSEIADIQTAEMLQLNVPKIKDGKATLVISEPSEFQKEYMFELGERADKVRAGCDPRVDNMLKITNEAKLMAIDPRLLSDDYPIHTDGKLFKCAEQVHRIWEESKKQRSTQIIFSDVGTPKENQFDAYNEMKRLLEEHGIPGEEIAFVHDAKNDKQREELFEKVRTGNIRVLLGSTEKLGTGTNVQHKLLAVHHLDVPWRPSDLTQRDGRIVRQGNENQEVQIYRYVAKDSFDSYLWQVQENKLRFINQIMSNRSYARSADDVDQTLLNAAEAKAIATGNPKILEKINTDKEVMTLQMLKNSYQENKLKMSRWLENYPHEKQNLEIRLKHVTQDNQVVITTSKQDFQIKIGESVYTDKSEALKALNQHFPQALDIMQVQAKEIGEYRGFKLSIVPNTTSSANLIMEGQAKHIATIEKNGTGSFVRMDNVLEAIPKKINDLRNNLSDLEKRYIDTQTQLQKPFEQEQQLQNLLQKQVEINLEIESGEKINASNHTEKAETLESRDKSQQTQEYER